MRKDSLKFFTIIKKIFIQTSNIKQHFIFNNHIGQEFNFFITFEPYSSKSSFMTQLEGISFINFAKIADPMKTLYFLIGTSF